MRPVAAMAALILVMIAVLLFIIYSGVYNVAATEPHTGFTRWLLGASMERSVRNHAEGIDAPPLSESSPTERGFEHYREMCVGCHGAPGVSVGEIGEGLNPEPPDLAEEVGEWTDAELYWITKHGIKMTGMPGFGPTHTEEDLWAIVAFLKRLPGMTAAEYQALVDAKAGSDHERPHDHHH